MHATFSTFYKNKLDMIKTSDKLKPNIFNESSFKKDYLNIVKNAATQINIGRNSQVDQALSQSNDIKEKM